MNNSDTETLKSLFKPQTIRERAHHVLELGVGKQLRHFNVNLENLVPTADYVIKIMKERYSNLDIPFHSRWRHFEAGNHDRVHSLKTKIANLPSLEQGKIFYELAIISVFLDAGAGSLWSYQELATQEIYNRSEGLALATFESYLSGKFSNIAGEPLRVDAECLKQFDITKFKECFQVNDTNPLEGLEGRVSLLNRLGIAIEKENHIFGNEGRLGDFYVTILNLQQTNILPVNELFQMVLKGFNTIWPTRLQWQDISLGDVWQLSVLRTNRSGSEYIPFHKLSQWLTYSLIEPLEWNGITVMNVNDLTGLPEYRNGGLFIDFEVMVLKDKELANYAHAVDSELIIEWRALTIALLDELSSIIRNQLGKTSDELPLVKILQGGTWEAGRRIALQKRTAGLPPIQIISDGTVF